MSPVLEPTSVSVAGEDQSRDEVSPAAIALKLRDADRELGRPDVLHCLLMGTCS